MLSDRSYGKFKMAYSQTIKYILIWFSPFIAAFGTASFVTLKNAPFSECDSFDCSWYFAFSVWFLRDAIANYIFALPLLLMLRKFNFKNILFYLFVGFIGGFPVAHMLANPLIYTWTPTKEDFEYGTYWLLMFSYMLLSSITGLSFWLGARSTVNNL